MRLPKPKSSIYEPMFFRLLRKEKVLIPSCSASLVNSIKRQFLRCREDWPKGLGTGLTIKCSINPINPAYYQLELIKTESSSAYSLTAPEIKLVGALINESI